MNISKALAAVTAAVTLTLPVYVQAQAGYPNRTITMVVPYTPGSTSDITARAIAQKISGPLGQSVIIENRPGANGQIGMQIVARAKPDGYTLVVGSVSSTVVPAVVQKTVPFDIVKDFAPVSVIASTALLMVVVKDAPYNTLSEFVAAAKAAPRTMSYANSAGLYQIAMEALNLQAGIDMTGVPYKGPAEATNDLLGGRITVAPDSLGSATGLIQAGRTKPLVVLSSNRTAALPQVPTMLELGYKDFRFNGWIGILAPAGTPSAIVQRLHEEISKAVNSPDVQQQFHNVALDPVSLGPKEYAELIAQESAKYQRIGRDAHIEKQ